jgi:PAS domain S-box-containing protein
MKSWNNLFEELFTDLEREPPFETYAQGGTLPGWLWECDDFGNYLTCSPEIEDVLGYSPQEMIGQPLTGFALPAKSARKISNVLKMGNLPTEISIEFIDQKGDVVPVSLFIYNAITTGGRNTGLRGFAQVLLDLDKNQPGYTKLSIDQAGVADGLEPQVIHENVLPPLVDADSERIGDDNILDEGESKSEIEKTKVPGITAALLTPKSDDQVISEMIVQGLEKIRVNSPEIFDSPISRVTVTHREEFQVDRTKEPLVKETLAGKVVHSYPKVLVRQTVVRLEWGTKFDLTEEERAFISRSRLCPSGLEGFLRRRLAPKSILKTDYDWISVVILDEQGKEPRVWVHYSQEGVMAGGWSIKEISEEPELVFKQVEKVINNPRQVREVLLRGENYLLD